MPRETQRKRGLLAWDISRESMTSVTPRQRDTGIYCVSEGFYRGLICVSCQHFLALLPKKLNHGFFWVCTNATPSMGFVPICQVASQARRAVTAKTAQPRERAFRERLQTTRCSATSKWLALLARVQKMHPSIFTLFMEFTRWMLTILYCFNAKHVSKISISFALTQEIGWGNFPSQAIEAYSYYSINLFQWVSFRVLTGIQKKQNTYPSQSPF